MTEKNSMFSQPEKSTISGVEEQLKYDTHREALSYYEIFKLRFLHVNSWRKFTGKTGIKFELAGLDGQLVENENAREGLLIRVDIPGAEPRSGSRYDWLRIERVADEYDPMNDEASFSMRVRSVPEPGFISTGSQHFPNEELTNIFTLRRIGTGIVASVNGRSGTYEKETHGFFSKLKNLLLAIFSLTINTNTLWKIFLKGILDKK